MIVRHVVKCRTDPGRVGGIAKYRQSPEIGGFVAVRLRLSVSEAHILRVEKNTYTDQMQGDTPPSILADNSDIWTYPDEEKNSDGGRECHRAHAIRGTRRDS